MFGQGWNKKIWREVLGHVGAWALLVGWPAAARAQPAAALVAQVRQQALAYCAHSDDLDGQAQVNYFAGDVEMRATNYPAARAYLRRAYALARQGQSTDRLEPITRLLALAEARTGHYAEAYRLRDLSAVLLDSVHVTEGQQAMEARYQNKDKQRQIGQLDRENRLRAAEAAAQRRAKYLAWGGWPCCCWWWA